MYSISTLKINGGTKKKKEKKRSFGWADVQMLILYMHVT